MRNKFWEEKNKASSSPKRSNGTKGPKIDISKLSPAQLEALKKALLGE